MDSVVNVIFKTQGDGNLRKINQELGKTDNVIKKTNGQLGKLGLGFGKAGTSAKGASVGVKVFGTAVKSALGPIGAALAAVGGLTAAFQTISNQDFAVAKVKSLGVEAGELNAELKRVSAELNNSASVAELTASAYDVASAGFTNAADAAQVLKAASMGATGGFTDMNTAGDALTSVLNAYGMSAEQATATMDKFIQTQNDGKIVVDEYARNIGKVASAAAGLGVPLEEVNAAIAQSTAAGVQAETAFTGLKTAIARLASGEANKVLEEFGVSVDSASIASDGLAGTLQKIVDAGLDTGQILKALGTEAGPALLPVLNNLDKFNELLEKQKDSAGASAEANKLATDTIQGAWNQLTNVFSNFFTDQTAAGDALKLVLEGITFVIENIMNAVNLALTPFKVLMSIINGIKQVVEKLGEGFEEAFDSPEGRAFLEVVKLIQQKIAEAAEWVGQHFKIAWDSVLDVVVEIGKFLGTTLLKAIDGVGTGLAATFGWLPMIGGKIKEAKEAWDGLKAGIEDSSASTEKVAKEINKTEDGLVKAEQAAKDFAEAQKSAAFETAKITKELNIQEGQERISNQLAKEKTAELNKQTAALQAQNNIRTSALDIGGPARTGTSKGISRTDLPQEINEAIKGSTLSLIRGFGQEFRTKEQNRMVEEARLSAEALKDFKTQLSDTDQTFKEIMTGLRANYGETAANYISDYAKEMYENTKGLSAVTGKALDEMNNKVSQSARYASAAQSGASGTFTPSSTTRYMASGGYVNTPTRAVIGEGGEGEYIVPESKMFEAMQRFGRGQRGESVVPSSASVNVSWSGDTIQMDGKDYIEKSQMPGLIQTAVNETMNTLHRNSRARAFAGL